MITLKEFEIKDWSEIKDAVEPFVPLEPTKDFLEISDRSIAVTAIENNNVMACGGITYLNNKEGITWMKISKKCKGYYWARTIREAFSLMREAVGNLVISTYILRDFCKGDKLAKLIGLKRTIETKQHNGNTYYKYMVI